MSTGRRLYFILAGLPVDDMIQQELKVEQVFNTKMEDLRGELEKTKKSLNDNGFDFDLVLISPRLGYKAVLDKLDEAEHVDGIILGFGIRAHPAPSVAILLEELIETLRYHPKNVKILFNWNMSSSLDACQRAAKQKAEKEEETAGAA